MRVEPIPPRALSAGPHRWLCLFVALASAFASGGVGAADLPPGKPFVESFRPTDISVYPQNFALVQDPDGIVYVGNYDGVLEFDGARWRLITLPKHQYARSLAVDSDGRVFVGSFGSFGYLARGADGAARFVDLTPADLSDEQRLAMGDIWEVFPGPESVLFRGVHDLYVWHRDGGLTHTHIQRGFGSAFNDGATVYLIRRGQGLTRVDDDRLTLLPGGERMAEVRGITPIALGSGRFLLASDDGHWRQLDHKGVSDVDPAGTALPDAATVYAAYGMPDGRVVLGTSEGKVLVLSADLSQARMLSLDATVVSDFAVARDGGLWATTYLGLYHLAIASPWSYYDPGDGLAGDVFDFLDVGPRRLVASSAGLYEMQPAPDALGRRFARLPYTLNEVWALAPWRTDGFLAATSYKLWRFRGNEPPQAISDTIYPRFLRRSQFDPGILIVGTENGVVIMRETADGEFSILGRFVDFGYRMYPIEEIASHQLWVGTSGNGALRITLSRDWGAIAQQERFGSEQGLKLGVDGAVNLSRVGSTVVFATDSDLFLERNGRFEPAHMPELEGLPERGGSMTFRASPNGTLWALGQKKVFLRPPGADWRGAGLSALGPLSINGLMFAADGTVLVSITGGLVRFDGGAEPKPATAARVLLRAVSAERGADISQPVPLDATSPPLSPGVTTLRFDYALPRFPGPLASEYRTRLVGLDPSWSAWTRNASQAYSNLGAGAYMFEVQARDAGGNAVPARFRFSIAPPWYRQPWAILIWSVLGALLLMMLVLFAVRRRTAALERRNRSLESLISERTNALEMRSRELELANRQLRDLADRDGLTGVANRRRLDDVLDSACERARSDGLPLAVLMVDVDHFKAFNDQRGHLEGDRALRLLAEDLKRYADQHDGLVARYGGEEFAVIAFGKDAAHAGTIAEGLRRTASDGELGRMGLTVSVGVATARGDSAQPLLLLQRADAALYRAKRGGRNRVATA